MDLFLLESKTCLSLIIEISQLSHTMLLFISSRLLTGMAFLRFWCLITEHNFWEKSLIPLRGAHGFRHVTSSLRFLQSLLQTVKNLLKKAGDPFLALLAYKATRLQSGYSPAQLFMGWRFRTRVSTLSSQPFRQAVLPDGKTFDSGEREKRRSDTETTTGVIVSKRSLPCHLENGDGQLTQRHQELCFGTTQLQGPTWWIYLRGWWEATANVRANSWALGTRSGRAIVPPGRLNLWTEKKKEVNLGSCIWDSVFSSLEQYRILQYSVWSKNYSSAWFNIDFTHDWVKDRPFNKEAE